MKLNLDQLLAAEREQRNHVIAKEALPARVASIVPNIRKNDRRVVEKGLPFRGPLQPIHIFGLRVATASAGSGRVH